MGEICGSIGITGSSMALRGPEFGRQPLRFPKARPGHPTELVQENECLTELEERSKLLDSRFAFPDFAIFPKVVASRVGAVASEV